MSGEGSSSRTHTVSEAALEKKKRAEAEQPYRPYVHDIGETGALTGAVMPKNVTRSGVDDMENIGEFFRSPEQSGPSRGLSFAALGGPPTPSGPNRPVNGESPSGIRGSSMDVEDAVNEANDEDHHEGDDTVPKPQYFPPVKRTPPPQLHASSSRRTPQPDPASLYDALPSPSRSTHQSPYGSASRIPIAVAHRRTSSYPPPSPQDPHHTSPASVAARSAKNSSVPLPTGEGRKKLAQLTNGTSSPGMNEVDSLVPIQDPDSLMDDVEDDDDDVEMSREQATAVSRARPSIAARSSAAASIAATEVETEAGDISFASTQDDDAGPQPTYSDDGREEYDPQPADESQVDDDVTEDAADESREDAADETLDAEEEAEQEQEDDEDEQEVHAGPSKSSKTGKKIVPAESEAEEDDVENHMDDHPSDGQANDYEDHQDEQPEEEQEQSPELEDRSQEEEEEEEEEAAPAKTKGKGKEKEVAKPKKPKKSPKKAVQAQRKRLADMSSDSEDESNNRRSRRKRFAPLEYWRGEKLVFGRRESGQPVVPIIKEVLRLPKEEPKKRPQSGRERSSSAKPKPKRAKRESRSHSGSEEPEERQDGPPAEYGWDDETVEHGIVMDFASKTEIERRIAFPSHLLEYRTMPGDANGFKFQKVFGDASFVAAGMLEIPVGGEKPSKPTKDNTYLFYVIEGAVTVKVHRTSFTMAPGGQFMVPRGNQYSLHTISHRPAKLFFAQARKMAADEEDVAPAPVVASKSSKSGGSASKSTNGKKKTVR